MKVVDDVDVALCECASCIVCMESPSLPFQFFFGWHD